MKGLYGPFQPRSARSVRPERPTVRVGSIAASGRGKFLIRAGPGFELGTPNVQWGPPTTRPGTSLHKNSHTQPHIASLIKITAETACEALAVSVICMLRLSLQQKSLRLSCAVLIIISSYLRFVCAHSYSYFCPDKVHPPCLAESQRNRHSGK